jgi:hypothetical protein
MWLFHIYKYHTQVWFIVSIFFPFSPLPFLKWFQQDPMCHIHTSIECASTIFILLYTFHLPFPSPSNLTYFTFLTFIVLECVLVLWCVALVFSLISILYFNQSTLQLFVFLILFFLVCIVQQSVVHFIVSSFYTNVIYFSIVHCLSFFCSSLSFL